MSEHEIAIHTIVIIIAAALLFGSLSTAILISIHTETDMSFLEIMGIAFIVILIVIISVVLREWQLRRKV